MKRMRLMYSFVVNKFERRIGDFYFRTIDIIECHRISIMFHSQMKKKYVTIIFKVKRLRVQNESKIEKKIDIIIPNILLKNSTFKVPLCKNGQTEMSIDHV